MEKQTNQFQSKINLLKEARLQLLKLHKLLIDIERENYEQTNGKITSGQFLNLLLNDANFAWLRKFSTLIVEIDEMMDLNDGFSEEMLEKHLTQMKNLLNLDVGDEEFESKYRSILQTSPEAAGRHSDLKNLLSSK